VKKKRKRNKGNNDEVRAATQPSPPEEVPFEVRLPSSMPTFRDVGGMDAVKQQLHDTLGTMLAYPDVAAKYGVRWNGILLHGPTGSGKTFLAEATAGEFALNFLSVSSGELLSAYRGRAGQRIAEAFELARRHLPCILFFDEFDSFASRRSASPQGEERALVSQLLRSLDHHRALPELIVMAATNEPDRLDEAVVRPGRFDRRIRIDLPDTNTREKILGVLVATRPAEGVDLGALAERTAGLSPAALRQIVDGASLEAMQSEARDDAASITQAMLYRAIAERGGSDRPQLSEWSWDALVLPKNTKLELMEFERFIEDPELPRRFGVEAPSGLLLFGPPGTGKTTVAKVLAAQASASFYPISPSDLISKWVGETEENISTLFARARENRPSIVFLDEADAMFRQRGVVASFDDRWTDQLLQEIDGIRSNEGVFVIGATNRPDLLDPALLRGGRLSRHVEIPLPGPTERRQLIDLICRRMPLARVDFDELVRATDGFSGADLKALAQDAAIKASIRASSNGKEAPAVTGADFRDSLADLMSERSVA
jgi:transitional endoplasmic reticulum ATPase